jgi:H+/Cl- antiporter ClcA
MKTSSIIAAGLATALAATSFAGSAMARPYRHFHHHHYYHHEHSDIGPAIVAGTIFGMIGAALANSYHHPYDGYRDAHVRWCADHYRTYNPATNMFYARPGVREYCHSPYD